MKRIQTICLGCAAFLISGCLPDPLTIDTIPMLAPRMVVSTQLLQDSSVVLLLTSSFGALDANGDSDPIALLNQIAINDATVVIKGGDYADTLTLFGPGLYRSDPLPFGAQNVYTMLADSPAFGNITAIAQLNSPVVFSALTARINDTGFDTLATIHYAFQDALGASYYMMNAQKIMTAMVPEAEEFLNPRVFTKLLRDQVETDGLVLRDSFNVLFQDDFSPGDTLLVQLANISEGYYNFLKLRQDSRFNFADFLGEPINYPSNVEGGLGWFTLHLPDVRTITVDE